MYPHLGIIKKLNTKYNDVLDIGCGSGSFSITFKKIFGIPNFFLVDNSLSALFLGKKIFEYFGEECELIQCDARKLPFKEKSFDLVYSTGLLEHFDKSDQERIVNENCRVSRDIICQVPTNSVPYWMMRFFITIVNRKWPFGNEIPLSMDDLEQLFTKNNYTINYVSYHDLLTSMFFLLSSKTKFIKPLEKKTFLNRCLKHEIAIYAIETNKDGLHSTN